MFGKKANPLNYAKAVPEIKEKAFELVIPGEPVVTKNRTTDHEREAIETIRDEFIKRHGRIKNLSPVSLAIIAVAQVPEADRAKQTAFMQSGTGIQNIGNIDNLARTVMYGLVGAAYEDPGEVDQLIITKSYGTISLTRVVVTTLVEVTDYDHERV